MAKLLMKADEASIQPPIPIPKHELEDSPTKVSIPLSPSTFKFLKLEPPVTKPVIQFIVPTQPEEEEVDVFKVPTRVIVPVEESSFIDNVEDVTVNMRFLNCIPKMKKQCRGLAQAVIQKKISEKVLTRMNAILDIIKSRTVIDSINLLSLLRQAELNLPEELCRKSMLTLCGKLAADNFLKVIELELKSDKKSVQLIFFGEPTVSFDMRCWHSIIEEQKIQHFLPHHRAVSPRPFPRPSSTVSFVSKTSIASEEFGPQSKRFENFPKFLKMKLFHEFLFYLIYAYPADHKKIPIRKAIEVWGRENPKILEHEDITENITNCYSTEVSWKMFVSPLNPQRDYENGWGLLRDIIHRLPLILFVKFTRAAQGTDELNEFLQHPIKCNYLLHFLPGRLREQLLQGRKHVFVIQELCKKLCWCGLLQFGPARTKEVDQTFVYLNRNATLLDTMSSDVGYLEVSDRDYPALDFHFDSPDKVTSYWNQMFQIAVNTKINKKSTAIGRTVEIEQLSTKPALQEALKVQTPVSAVLNDDGKIPGDHKGAAGLDKAFLTHLKRNWTRPLENESLKLRRATLSARPKVKKVKSTVVKEIAAKIKSKSISSAQAKFKISQKSKIIRKIGPAKRAMVKVPSVQDAVDKQALGLMKTMRVTWSEVEDKTLILVRLALKFAFPQDAQSSHYIGSNVIRDILHWCTDKASNKTSKACSRRIQYLVKSKPAIKEQIAFYLEELRANPDFTGKYKNLIERLKFIYSQKDVYNAVKVHFVEMVHRMHQIFYKQYSTHLPMPTSSEVVTYQLPSDYETILKTYTISNPTDTLVDQRYRDPTNSNEAEISMLMALVHSAVCCNHDKTSYSYQHFEVYKKYADANLSAAVSQLKRATVITVNKNHQRKDKTFLPYSYSPFHLSVRYGTQVLGVHVPVELYDEYLSAVAALSVSSGSFQLNSINCGWIFMLAEMMSAGRVRLSYDRADKLVMVDPALQKKSNFDKISDNYMRLMCKDRPDGEARERKNVKFQTDETGDETFLFADDPIEIFCKLSHVHLHAFCILQALEKNETIRLDSWNVSDDGICCVESCVVGNDENFSDEARKISCKTRELVKEVLKGPSQGFSSANVVSKENFIAFFDREVQKHLSDFEENNRKDFCGKAMKQWKRTSPTVLLEAILRLANEPGLEDDAWLSEYKKVSQKADDDRMDDDDIDPSGEHIKHSKMLTQLKDLNVGTRTFDSFVVNLSTIYVDFSDGPGDKVTFEGRDIDHRLLPFSEVERAAYIERILADSKWTPSDLEVKDLFQELSSAGIKNTLDIMRISEVCTFLQSKTQMGATPDELLEIFTDKKSLQQQIETLIGMKFVLRVGVNEMRFVHKDFATFWLIDSFTVSREEAKKPSQDEGSSQVDEPAAKKRKIDDNEPSTSAAAAEAESEKKSTTHHPIRVRPSPWIRVNGTLNRRVIDKWLGTILNHLTISPSMMLIDLCNKFNILTPFDVRRLCEILEMIGSLRLMTISESDADLFSMHDGSTVGKLK